MLALFSDPALQQLVWTGSATILLVLSGGLALALLPWSDRDIAVVDRSFQHVVSPSPPRRATMPR